MLTAFEVPEGQSILEMFTPENQQKMIELQAQLADTPGVLNAVTPLSALQWTEQPRGRPAGAAAHGQPRRPDPPADASPARRPAPPPPTARTRRRRRDPHPGDRRRRAVARQPGVARVPPHRQRRRDPRRPAALLPRAAGRGAGRSRTPTTPSWSPASTGNQALTEQSDAAQAVKDAVDAVDFAPATTITTGAPMLLKDVNDYLQGGMLVLGALAVVVMIVVLSLAFRVRWRLTSLVVMLVGVIWAFGLLGYSGFELSLVTIAGLPDPHRPRGGVRHPGAQPRRGGGPPGRPERAPSPRRSCTSGPALGVSTVAGVIACLALLVSQVPMIREFGILLAVGIVMLFVAAIIIPVAVLSIRERRNPTTERPRAEARRAGHDHPQPPARSSWCCRSCSLTVVLFVLGLSLEEKTPIQTDPQKWVDQSSQTVKDVEASPTRPPPPPSSASSSPPPTSSATRPPSSSASSA